MTWRLFFGITANIETYIAYIVIITGIVYEVTRLFVDLGWKEQVYLSLKTFHQYLGLFCAIAAQFAMNRGIHINDRLVNGNETRADIMVVVNVTLFFTTLGVLEWRHRRILSRCDPFVEI